MYKIYINERPIILCESADLPQFPLSSPRWLVAPYSGKGKTLFNYVDTLEKSSPKIDAIVIHSPDLEGLWSEFSGHYRIVEAAGGLVQNEDGEWLFIFRRGTWDLPKGKIDPGELPPQAAVREVQEETGLQRLTLGPLVGMTYHTYRDQQKRRCLKPTYWYQMSTPDKLLVPQAEENIEQAVWMNQATFEAGPHPIYQSLADLLAIIWRIN